VPTDVNAPTTAPPILSLAENVMPIPGDSPRDSEVASTNNTSLEAPDHSRQDGDELSNVDRQKDSALQLSHLTQSTTVFTTTRDDEKSKLRDLWAEANSERGGGNPVVVAPELLRAATQKANSKTLSENFRISDRLLKLPSQAVFTEILKGKNVQENGAGSSTQNKVSAYYQQSSETEFPLRALAPSFNSLLGTKDLRPYGPVPFQYSQSHSRENKQMDYPYKQLKVKPEGIALDAYLNEDILRQSQEHVWSPGHLAGSQEIGNILSGRNILKNALPVVEYLPEPKRVIEFKFPVIEAETEIISSNEAPHSIIYPALREAYDATPSLKGIFVPFRSEGGSVPDLSRPYQGSPKSDASFAPTFQDRLLISPKSPRDRESDELKANLYPAMNSYEKPQAPVADYVDTSAEFPSAIRTPTFQAEVEFRKDPAWTTSPIRIFSGQKQKNEVQTPPAVLDVRDAKESRRKTMTAEHLSKDIVSHDRPKEPEPNYLERNLAPISKKDIFNAIADDSKVEGSLPYTGITAINANTIDRKLKPVSERLSDVSNWIPETVLTRFSKEIPYSTANLMKSMELQEGLGTHVHAVEDQVADVLTIPVQTLGPKLISENVYIIPQSEQREVSFHLHSREPNSRLRPFSHFPQSLETQRNSEFGAPVVQMIISPHETASVPFKFQEEHVISSGPTLSDWLPLHSDIYGDTAAFDARDSDEFPVAKQTELLLTEAAMHAPQSVNRGHKTVPTKLNDERLVTNGKSDARKHQTQSENSGRKSALPTSGPNVSKEPADVLQISRKFPPDASTHSAQTQTAAPKINHFGEQDNADTTEILEDINSRRFMFDNPGYHSVQTQEDIRTNDRRLTDTAISASDKQPELLQTVTGTSPTVAVEHADSSSAETEEAPQITSKLVTNPHQLQSNSVTEKHLDWLSTEPPSPELTGYTEESNVTSSEVLQELGVRTEASKSVSEEQHVFVSAETNRPVDAAADAQYSKSIQGVLLQGLDTVATMRVGATPISLDYTTEKQLNSLPAISSVEPQLDMAYITTTSHGTQQEAEIETLLTQPPKADSSKTRVDPSTGLFPTEPSTTTASTAEHVKNFTAEKEEEVESRSVLTDASELSPSNSATAKRLDLLSTERSTESQADTVDTSLPSESEKVFENKGVLTETSELNPSNSATAKTLDLLSTERSTESQVDTNDATGLPAESEKDLTETSELNPSNSASAKTLDLLSTERSTESQADTNDATGLPAESEKVFENKGFLTETSEPSPSNSATAKRLDLLSTERSTESQVDTNDATRLRAESEKVLTETSELNALNSATAKRLDLLSTERSTESPVDTGYTALVPSESEKVFRIKEMLIETSKADPTNSIKAEQFRLSTDGTTNSSALEVSYNKDNLAELPQDLDIGPPQTEELKAIATDPTRAIGSHTTSQEPATEADFITYTSHEVEDGSGMTPLSTVATNARSSQSLSQQEFQQSTSEQNIKLTEYATNITNISSVDGNETVFTPVLTDTAYSAPSKYATETPIEFLPPESSAEVRLNGENNTNMAAEAQQVLGNGTLLTEVHSQFESKLESEDHREILPPEASGKFGAEIHQGVKTEPILTMTHTQMPLEFMTEKQVETLSPESRAPSGLESQDAEGISAELADGLLTEHSVSEAKRLQPNNVLPEHLSSKQSTEPTGDEDYIKYISTEMPQVPEIKSLLTETGVPVIPKSSAEAVIPKSSAEEGLELLSTELSKDMTVGGKYIGSIPTERGLEEQDSGVTPLGTGTAKPVEWKQEPVLPTETAEHVTRVSTDAVNEIGVEGTLTGTLRPVLLESAPKELFQLVPTERDIKPGVEVEFTRNVSPELRLEPETSPLLSDANRAVQLKHATDEFTETVFTEPATETAAHTELSVEIQQGLDTSTQVQPNLKPEFLPTEQRTEPIVGVEYTRNVSAEVLKELAVKPLLSEPTEPHPSQYITEKQPVVPLNKTGYESAFEDNYISSQSQQDSDSKHIQTDTNRPGPSKITNETQLELTSAGPKTELAPNSEYNRQDSTDMRQGLDIVTDTPSTLQSKSETDIRLQELPPERSSQPELESEHSRFVGTRTQHDLETGEQGGTRDELAHKSANEEQLNISFVQPVTEVASDGDYTTDISAEIQRELHSGTMMAEREKQAEFVSGERSTETSIGARHSQNLSPEVETEVKPILTATSEAAEIKPATDKQAELLSDEPGIDLALQCSKCREYFNSRSAGDRNQTLID
jgi:hypothetical protein